MTPGLKEIRLTDNPGDDYAPVFSPDGSQIAYTAFVKHVGVGVWIMDANGQHQRQITPRTMRAFNPTWNPDGTRIAFHANSPGLDNIWSIGADGKDLKLLTNTLRAHDVYPTWSPTGEKIAFVSTRTEEVEVWTMNPDGTNQEMITTGGFGDYVPSWSPDGKKIAFASTRAKREDIMERNGGTLPNYVRQVFAIAEELEEPNGDGDIFVIDVASREMTQITSDSAHEWHPAWSPDGRWIAYISDKAGSRDIWVMRADGTDQRQVTRHPAQDRLPMWSQDGTQLIFTSNRTGHWDIWMVDVPPSSDS